MGNCMCSTTILQCTLVIKIPCTHRLSSSWCARGSPLSSWTCSWQTASTSQPPSLSPLGTGQGCRSCPGHSQPLEGGERMANQIMACDSKSKLFLVQSWNKVSSSVLIETKLMYNSEELYTHNAHKVNYSNYLFIGTTSSFQTASSTIYSSTHRGETWRRWGVFCGPSSGCVCEWSSDSFCPFLPHLWERFSGPWGSWSPTGQAGELHTPVWGVRVGVVSECGVCVVCVWWVWGVSEYVQIIIIIHCM